MSKSIKTPFLYYYQSHDWNGTVEKLACKDQNREKPRCWKEVKITSLTAKHYKKREFKMQLQEK